MYFHHIDTGQSIEMCITSLPPEIPDCLLHGGIWLGSVKQTILDPVLKRIDELDVKIYVPERTQIKDIDRALLCIKPPHEFRRTPRILRNIGWKASEYRAWLLF